MPMLDINYITEETCKSKGKYLTLVSFRWRFADANWRF